MPLHKTGLDLHARAIDPPSLCADSWWAYASRQGFSDVCIARFGISFEGERIKPLSEPSMPKGRRMTRVYQSNTEAITLQKKRSHGRGMNTVISQKAMQSGASLIG